MELASMLAGEPFTDEPKSVCPVVAGFLRSYNDGIGDAPRQDLYRFAALAVGMPADGDVIERRNSLCLEAVHGWHMRLRGLPWRLLPAPVPDPLRGDGSAGTLAGAFAAKLVRRKRPGAREAALDLAERLIACTAAEPAPSGDLPAPDSAISASSSASLCGSVPALLAVDHRDDRVRDHEGDRRRRDAEEIVSNLQLGHAAAVAGAGAALAAAGAVAANAARR